MLLLLALFACDGGDKTDDTAAVDRVDAILALTGDEAAGQTVFESPASCASCHLADGTGDFGTDITGETDAEFIITTVINGNTAGMTAFGDILSDQEIADVTAYTISL